jgi:hypothetical protein
MKMGVCEKFGKFGWIDQHHILPISVFGSNKETSDLCPSCHRDYHNKLGTENLMNNSMEFHFNKFYR